MSEGYEVPTELPGSTGLSYPVIYVVANPVVVRGLLDRKKIKGHLQSYNESMKKKGNLFFLAY